MIKSVKRKYRISAMLFTLLLLFSGCGRQAATPEPQCRVVTSVRVSFENGPIQAERCYTSSAKMRAVLNYLRWIAPYGTPEEDPETASGSSFHIVLTYSDGCEKTYLQKSDRFMQTDGGAWQTIDPKKAENLSQLLGQMESDED